MSNLIELLNIQPAPVEPNINASVGAVQDHDIDIEIVSTDPDMELAVDGLESLSGLLNHEVFSGKRLSGLSGCEGFALGVVSCYANDLRKYDGNEGFVDNVKKGLKATIDTILAAVKKVFNMLFGESDEKKKLDAIRKETNETIKNIKVEKPAELNLKIGESGVADLQVGLSAEEIKIIDDFMTTDMTFSQVCEKLEVGFNKTDKELTDLTNKTRPKLTAAESKIKQAEQQLSSLSEDDKDKKARIQKLINEGKTELEATKQETRAIQDKKRELKTMARATRNADRRLGKGRK